MFTLLGGKDGCANGKISDVQIIGCHINAKANNSKKKLTKFLKLRKFCPGSRALQTPPLGGWGALFNLPCRYTFIGDLNRQDFAILVKVHFVDAGNTVVAICFG